jgi:hypothetical protein
LARATQTGSLPAPTVVVVFEEVELDFELEEHPTPIIATIAHAATRNLTCTAIGPLHCD